MTGPRVTWDRELDELASPAPLLQTWGWGEVQSRAGWAIERLRLSGGAMASVQLRGIGPVREAYVPRGPVPPSPGAIGALIDWARSARVARILVEPEAPFPFGDEMRERGFTQVAAVQPQHTRILTLGPPAEMLASFKHGRRYNIRAGERRGVVIEEGKDATELERQSSAVERRESIHLPARSYYQLLLDDLPWCRTYVGRHPETNEALSAVLVARHGGRAYHLFAGRSGEHPELMANDLAWWAAIKSAAQDGCRDYDLWGVPPPEAGPDHPWHGLGFFKAEFGGQELAYAGAWELVLSETGSRLIGLEKKARGRIRGLKRNIS
ncbi:MAG TPA: peptidoglycan bridge formation glycyltransferase FemA/FemB family protein [Candidatus Dormibacteraeota bacterium]|nr:peptidoglycan bridge formation glycyltransferase FemA/FemB family protein [Candidatus Dormibacteraeota bacterium]